MSDFDFTRQLDRPECAGVRRLRMNARASIEAAAAARGFAVFHLDLGACRDKDDLLARIAAALDFPEWFGRNWDALADCLGDMSWRLAPGYVILADPAGGDCGGALGTALEIFGEAADEWAADGVPFWIFLAEGAPAAPIPPP